MVKLKSNKVDMFVNPHNVLYIKANEHGNTLIRMANGEIVFSNEPVDDVAKKLEEYM